LKRGEIWTSAGGNGYAGKPRPVLIIQDDSYADTNSIAVCLITSEQIATSFIRPPLKPDAGNGLNESSRIMVDKVAAVPRSGLRKRVGRVSGEQMRAVEDALMTFLGMAR